MTPSATLTTAPSLREIVLPIDGMNCAGCVRAVETALDSVPGAHGASASLTNMTATVTLDREVAPEALVAAVRKAGYDVPKDEIDLRIDGMTCASCVGRVEAALAKVNLPEYDVSLGWLIMRPFFLPRQAPYFHLREPSRSSWG